MRAGRRPNLEGTRLLFAGTISRTICLGDGPTEGRHDKTRRKARKKLEKKRKEKQKREQRRSEKTNKHFYVQLVGQGRHKRLEGRQRKRGKSNNKTHEGKNKHQLEHRVTQSMQRCRVRAYHRLGREQGNTAKNRDWNCASTGLISTAQKMHPADTYSLGVSLPPAWPDTHTRTAPRGYKFIRVGTTRNPHCPHHLSRNIIFRIILQEAQHW